MHFAGSTNVQFNDQDYLIQRVITVLFPKNIYIWDSFKPEEETFERECRHHLSLSLSLHSLSNRTTCCTKEGST